MMIIYGSPRKHGNSATIAKEFAEEAKNSYSVEPIYLQDLALQGCRGCTWCKANGKCIIDDGMNDICENIPKTDALCFVSPVYWWGISAQLKTFLDRLYQMESRALKGKKFFLIVTGEDTLDGIQYKLIKEQFEAICDYTGMEFAGYLPVCADDGNPAKENAEALSLARALSIKA